MLQREAPAAPPSVQAPLKCVSAAASPVRLRGNGRGGRRQRPLAVAVVIVVVVVVPDALKGKKKKTLCKKNETIRKREKGRKAQTHSQRLWTVWRRTDGSEASAGRRRRRRSVKSHPGTQENNRQKRGAVAPPTIRWRLIGCLLLKTHHPACPSVRPRRRRLLGCSASCQEEEATRGQRSRRGGAGQLGAESLSTKEPPLPSAPLQSCCQ